jgi:hypothetical protein
MLEDVGFDDGHQLSPCSDLFLTAPDELVTLVV